MRNLQENISGQALSSEGNLGQEKQIQGVWIVGIPDDIKRSSKRFMIH